jgi:hypothetical protein
MKRLLIFIILILMGSSAFGQDPDLFDNQWYLEELVIDSEVIPALFFPPEPKIGRIHFDPGLVEIVFCDAHGATPVYDLNQNIFTLDGFVTLGEGCKRQENVDFENIYLTIFEEQEIIKNPFSYDILPRGNGVLGLTITNGEGDQAIYGNNLLSSLDANLNEIKIHPNPSSSQIFIESKIDPITKVELYNLLGESIQTVNDNVDSIDISDLASGIYLLRIFSEKESTVKKIIKQ